MHRVPIQPAGTARYGQHDLLRAYACELAADIDGPDASRDALTRLFDHYLHRATAAVNALHRHEQHQWPRTALPDAPTPPLTSAAQALAWLDAQRENLLAVVAYATRQGWPGHATRLSATLFRYLNNGGHFPDAIIVFGHAVAAAREGGDQEAEVEALTSLGVAHGQQSRYPEATGLLSTAIALGYDTGNRYGESSALNSLGQISLRRGGYPEATGYFQQALELCRASGNLVGAAVALNGLGEAYLAMGRFDEALAGLTTALRLARRIDDKPVQARTHDGLGQACVALDDPNQARRH
ncbi:MAG: tetratricopeptide repeat protein [Streptosporangiaceae bacterium]